MLRLDKIISSQTLLSRSQAGKLVRSGEVTVDGEIVKTPASKFDANLVEILLQGQRIDYKKNIYIMMNKPQDVISASRDPHDITVIDILPEEFLRPDLFPAGRLDKDTTGLLIITNDGKYAHKMLAPKNKIEKTYHAKLSKPVEQKDIQAFLEGIVLEDNTKCAPAKLSILDDCEKPLVEIKLTEGKYHQVKRMVKSIENSVLSLKRVAIGTLFLDKNLETGESKELEEAEYLAVFEKTE